MLELSMPFEQRKIPLREIVGDTLKAKGLDVIIDLVQTVLSVISCGIYVCQTYDETLEENRVLFWIEMVLGCIFTVDYFLWLFVSPNRWKHLYDMNAIIDVVTIIPVFVSFTQVIIMGQEAGSVDFNMLRFVRVLRMLRILRVYRLLKFSEQSQSQQKALLIFTIMSILFCAAGTIQVLEQSENELSFHSAFYFIVVTITTVGYGDISPETTMGQAVIVVTILLSLVLIPKQLSALREMAQTEAETIYFTPSRGQEQHVICTGFLTQNTIERFLHEFFHPTHGKQTTHVCFLSSIRPGNKTRSILQRVLWRGKVTYLKGSVHNPVDLERAQLSLAKTVFILTGFDTSVSDQKRLDASVIMQALSIRTANPTVQILSHVFSLENQKRLKWIIGDQGKQGACVSLDALKFRMLAMNCVCPGVCAFIINLIRSVNETRVEQEGWMKEFQESAMMGLYPVHVPSAYDGMLFSRVVEEIYMQFEATLIGARLNGRVVLYPKNYTMKKGDICFVIARSAAHAFHISRGYMFSNNSLRNFQQNLFATSGDSLGRLDSGNKKNKTNFDLRNFASIEDSNVANEPAEDKKKDKKDKKKNKKEKKNKKKNKKEKNSVTFSNPMESVSIFGGIWFSRCNEC
eukprot:TRINITY_DN2267_c0_g1_i1.p1 TRINITY_DN2267_c0_g1~~TRINITY_DN2267_c0_g1_i1.p1  ORF type:complete len:630 (-),score=143.65 TRINITY_DN2267_c0_g1_i1:100-1989(-)